MHECLWIDLPGKRLHEAFTVYVGRDGANAGGLTFIENVFFPTEKQRKPALTSIGSSTFLELRPLHSSRKAEVRFWRESRRLNLP